MHNPLDPFGGFPNQMEDVLSLQTYYTDGAGNLLAATEPTNGCTNSCPTNSCTLSCPPKEPTVIILVPEKAIG